MHVLSHSSREPRAARPRPTRAAAFALFRKGVPCPVSDRRGAAASRGYEYLAITDHSKALAMANGLDEHRAVEFAKHVRNLNRDGGLGIRVFSGLECDIRRDGTLQSYFPALDAAGEKRQPSCWARDSGA